MTTEELAAAFALKPMLATLGPLPHQSDEWCYEVKWDGVRALVALDHGTIRIKSRTGNDMTNTYPELVALAETYADHAALLDGEIVAFDESGRPSFNRLQSRLGLLGAAVEVRRHEIPVVLAVFDLLHLDGSSTRELPWSMRRRLLELLIDEPGPNWRLSTIHDDGRELLEVTIDADIEGVVAKRRDSIYRNGMRSPAWIKVKNLTVDEFVIGGWVPGDGRRSGRIGALLLGVPESDDNGARLQFIGKVGTGFSDAELERLAALLTPLVRPDSPFCNPTGERFAIYVEPAHRCNVAYREWTPSHTVRFPSYKGGTTY